MRRTRRKMRTRRRPVLCRGGGRSRSSQRRSCGPKQRTRRCSAVSFRFSSFFLLLHVDPCLAGLPLFPSIGKSTVSTQSGRLGRMGLLAEFIRRQSGRVLNTVQVASRLACIGGKISQDEKSALVSHSLPSRHRIFISSPQVKPLFLAKRSLSRNSPITTGAPSLVPTSSLLLKRAARSAQQLPLQTVQRRHRNGLRRSSSQRRESALSSALLDGPALLLPHVSNSRDSRSPPPQRLHRPSLSSPPFLPPTSPSSSPPSLPRTTSPPLPPFYTSPVSRLSTC
jgi:hypothetical protein